MLAQGQEATTMRQQLEQTLSDAKEESQHLQSKLQQAGEQSYLKPVTEDCDSMMSHLLACQRLSLT